ncbi:dolichol-phosphate mannosyltransferase subunit 3, partial [Atractiella rhizophila]
MTRFNRLLTYFFSATALWTLFYFDFLPLPLDDDVKYYFLQVLPFWLLISFGCWCLWQLGMGVYSFGECEQDYRDLLLEIKMAKDDLRTKGISV